MRTILNPTQFHLLARSANSLVPALILSVICLFGATRLTAEAPTSPAMVFEWDDAQLDVGFWYHYQFSDMNGQSAHDFYLYFPDQTYMQFLKNDYLEKNQNAISRLSYGIDPQRFALNSEEVVNLLPDTNKSYRDYHGTYDFGSHKISYKGTIIENGQDKPISQSVDLPVGINQFYNTLGTDIGLLFRFIKPASLPFVFNFVDTLRSVHATKIRFDKTETIQGIPCKKYLIEGQGVIAVLAGNNGALWLADDGGPRYMVRYTMNARVDWSMGNLMTKLVERKAMSAAEWQAFQDSMVADQKKQGKF
jgi:hypothetical protein